MKKVIFTMLFLLLLPQVASAQDDLMQQAISPIKTAPVAPPPEAPVVKKWEKPVTEEKAVEKQAPKKKAAKKAETHKEKPTAKIHIEENGMFRKKEEIGHGTMFRAKPPVKEEKPKKTEKSEKKADKSSVPALTEKDCQSLVDYQSDGSADYKPGVDAEGNPVAGVDLTPSVIQPPKKISFDLSVDMAKYMGITAPTGIEGKASMGTMTVENGQVKFNGKPVEGDAMAALKAYCAKKAK